MSPNFTLAELTRSETADRIGDRNYPTKEHHRNLAYLACRLEEIRAILKDGRMNITSAYRNPRVNRAVGGVPNSDHAQGLAADFHCYDYGSDYEVCRAIANSSLDFDQLIYEIDRSGRTWVHIGFGLRMRRQVLTWKNRTYYRGLVK